MLSKDCAKLYYDYFKVTERIAPPNEVRPIEEIVDAFERKQRMYRQTLPMYDDDITVIPSPPTKEDYKRLKR